MAALALLSFWSKVKKHRMGSDVAVHVLGGGGIPCKGGGSTTWPVLSQGSQHIHIATQQGSVDNMPRQGISSAAHTR